MPSKSFVGKLPQLASASKATFAVLSQLSGPENVLLNDFIDNELDSEDDSEHRASASLPDSVPIESEEERVLHVNKMRLLSMLSGIMRQTVMLEFVPQDIVIKTLKVWCACVSVFVFVCVCVCVCVRAVYMCS